LDQVWTELGSDDAAISLSATNRLSHAIKNKPEILTELKDRLGVNHVADDDQADKLIEDLDAPKFIVREKATATLKSMVERIRPILERRLEKSSQEAKWRINQILSINDSKPEIMTAIGRRTHRIVLALELCGNENALETLKILARRSRNPSMVQLANEAMVRL
ncbi:MAG: hypothetical protein AB8B55_03040, partial [Mariniblastus sp.]